MSHIWRKLLATKKDSEKYDIVKKEIHDLYNYYKTETKAKNYDEGSKALTLAVHMYHQLIVQNPSHPNKIDDMREALNMLKEKILLDGFIKRREIRQLLADDEPSEVLLPQPSHLQMRNPELQETYEKFKSQIKFPTGMMIIFPLGRRCC
jgi:hypothetical protein